MIIAGITLSGPQRLLAQTALFLAAVLTLEIAWSLLPPPLNDNPAAGLTEVTGAVDAQSIPRFALPPKTALQEAVERPIFERSRRGAFRTSGDKSSVSRASDIELVGIVISTAETFALMKAGSASGPTRVSVGGVIEGWEVSKIDTVSVLLTRGPEQERLYLPYPG